MLAFSFARIEDALIYAAYISIELKRQQEFVGLHAILPKHILRGVAKVCEATGKRTCMQSGLMCSDLS